MKKAIEYILLIGGIIWLTIISVLSYGTLYKIAHYLDIFDNYTATEATAWLLLLLLFFVIGFVLITIPTVRFIYSMQMYLSFRKDPTTTITKGIIVMINANIIAGILIVFDKKDRCKRESIE